MEAPPLHSRPRCLNIRRSSTGQGGRAPTPARTVSSQDQIQDRAPVQVLGQAQAVLAPASLRHRAGAGWGREWALASVCRTRSLTSTALSTSGTSRTNPLSTLSRRSWPEITRREAVLSDLSGSSRKPEEVKPVPGEMPSLHSEILRMSVKLWKILGTREYLGA